MWPSTAVVGDGASSKPFEMLYCTKRRYRIVPSRPDQKRGCSHSDRSTDMPFCSRSLESGQNSKEFDNAVVKIIQYVENGGIPEVLMKSNGRCLVYQRNRHEVNASHSHSLRCHLKVFHPDETKENRGS